MLKGFSGYYLDGKIVKDEKGNAINIPFSYKAMGRKKMPTSDLQGIESVPVIEKIEVMGNENPFKRMQIVKLKGAEFMVLNSNDTLFNQMSDILIIELEVQRN